MRKPNHAARPEVEGLDRRQMLSGVPPAATLTMDRLGGAAHRVRNVMGTLARTHDFDAAGRRLAVIAAGIPFGRRDLAESWRDGLASVDPEVRGSGLAARDRMIRDLYRQVQARAKAGEVRVVGRGAEAFGRGPSSNLANYNRIELVNLTGRPIEATTFLNVARPGPRPTIGPRAIGPERGDNVYDFDFGPRSPAARSISLEINATPTIQKFKEQPLAEPYGGAAFYVTTLGGYFVVSRQPPSPAS